MKNLENFCSISFLSSIIAQVLTKIKKQNVTLEQAEIMVEVFMIAVGVYFHNMVNGEFVTTLSDNCTRGGLLQLSQAEKDNMDFVFTI